MPTILDPLGSFNSQPMTPVERELVHTLRVMLKDIPDDVYRSLNTLVEEQRGERWSDMQLLIYINQAMADINAEPAHSEYDLTNFPPSWRACILNGGLIFALIAESILQTGEAFSYSDNGISLSINLAQGYQSMAQMLLTGYIQMRQTIKKAMRPQAAGLKSNANSVRLRSYAPRMWTYR